MTDAYSEIASRLTAYAQAFHRGDADKLGSIFASNCRLMSLGEAQLRSWTLDDWLALVRKRPSLQSQGHPIRFRIHGIQTVSKDCASAVLDMDAPPLLFVDMLHLLKVSGAWMIVAKTIHASTLWPAPSQRM